MAIIVKKRKSGLIIPSTPKLLIPKGAFLSGKSKEEEIIETEIKRIVRDTITIKTRKEIKKIIFFPIYEKVRGEKEISKIYLRLKGTSINKVIHVEAIESTGVSLLEFFDYIITNGAIEIQDATKALEIM
tara:strand:- start:368 stop:757 length:390 start_codon:yes stop_codon:yes gene_type:complete